MFEMGSWCNLLLLFMAFSSTSQELPPTSSNLRERFSEALEAILGTGLRLHALLEDPNIPNSKNFIVSPLSMAATVGQLMVGAEEPFLSRLYRLLNVDHDESSFNIIQVYGKDKNISYDLPYGRLHLQLGSLLTALERKEITQYAILHSANALFYNKDIRLRDDFERKMNIYDAQVWAMNFTNDPETSQDAINKWASDHTNGLIPNILPTPPSPSTSAIFANAIYFNAEWENPFSDELNLKSQFNCSDKKRVNVTYMRGFLEDIIYGESKNLNCKMVGIPYKNNELVMYILLPDKDVYDIRKFVQEINATELLKFIDTAGHKDVALQLPKMTLTSSISVLEPLEKYNVYTKQVNNKEAKTLDDIQENIDIFTAFNSTSNEDIILTGATERNSSLRISNILQQLILNVNEKGTEAAAVTIGTSYYMGGSKNFVVNRPFLFFIRHEATSAVLFWGTIVDPTQSQ